MESGLPERLRQCVYAVDASHVLQTAPTLGGFLSLNILCYLNGSPHMKFFYRNFATCGPGSRYFLQRMFGKPAINSVAMEAAGLKWLYDHQWTYWARLGEDPPHAWTIGIRPGMRVLDFENALCWAHRYVNAYLRKGYSSFANLPPPEYDPEKVASSSMPAWCDEERYAWNDSRPAFTGDYDEEAVKGKQEEQRRLDEEEEDVYEVEKIVCRKGSRTDKNGLFRVRWKGYPPEEDTWERASSLAEDANEVSPVYNCICSVNPVCRDRSSHIMSGSARLARMGGSHVGYDRPNHPRDAVQDARRCATDQGRGRQGCEADPDQVQTGSRSSSHDDDYFG